MNQFVIDPKTHYSIHDRWPSGGQNQSFCAKYCDYKRYQNGKFKMLFMFQTKTTKPPPPPTTSQLTSFKRTNLLSQLIVANFKNIFISNIILNFSVFPFIFFTFHFEHPF